jgi:hypothetical protein
MLLVMGFALPLEQLMEQQQFKASCGTFSCLKLYTLPLYCCQLLTAAIIGTTLLSEV